jgi:hypothetical protein
VPGRIHGLAKRLLEHRRPIGRRLLQSFVGKIERDDVDAVGCERLRYAGHEGMMLAGTGTVREDEQRAQLPFSRYGLAPSCVSSI